MIARVEAEHRDRYKKLLEMVKNGTVFKRDKPIRWKCAVCGYIHEGTEPPGKCPCCKHPKEYYEPERARSSRFEHLGEARSLRGRTTDHHAIGGRLPSGEPDLSLGARS